MGLLTFFGCLLTAYGPSATIFFFHINQNAQLVILLVSSAFFWLMSILFASIFWYIIPQLRGVFYFTIAASVLFQELFRWLFFLVFKRAEPSLNLVSPTANSRYNKPNYAFVSGVGFGTMSSLISYVAVLAESGGPGLLASSSCPSLSSYYVLALTTMLFSLLHIGWMMISFHGFYHKNWFAILGVVFLHLASSYVTILNGTTMHGGCAIALSVLAVELLVVSFLAYATVEGSFFFRRQYV